MAMFHLTDPSPVSVGCVVIPLTLWWWSIILRPIAEKHLLPFLTEKACPLLRSLLVQPANEISHTLPISVMNACDLMSHPHINVCHHSNSWVLVLFTSPSLRPPIYLGHLASAFPLFDLVWCPEASFKLSSFFCSTWHQGCGFSSHIKDHEVSLQSGERLTLRHWALLWVTVS